MDGIPLGLLELPADDEARARRFWSRLLGVDLDTRVPNAGAQSTDGPPLIGVHPRLPGETGPLPFFFVADMREALAAVEALGGEVITRDDRWSYCIDPEGNRFGLAADSGRPRRGIRRLLARRC